MALPLGLIGNSASAQTARPAAASAPQAAAGAMDSPLKPGWEHGAFIEIFVRGYADSNGDGIGDLRGLIQRLDYLQALGVSGIWLMPVTASADHDHGYATTDFRAIEPAYGSLADFDELLREAHRRGIGVIVDYVINHSAASHPLFQQSASAPDNRYRDWYVWQDKAPTGWDIWGKNPWYPAASGSYFGTFGAHMPDFNMRNPEVVAWHRESLDFWLQRGLDGFRLDAVPHLIENNARDWNDQPESRQLTAELVARIKRQPGRYVVCEATAEPQVWAAPTLCGGAFAFGLESQFVKAARGDTAAIQAVADYFKQAPAGMATMVSNHDIFAGERLYDQVRGDLKQYRLAAASYLLLPGTPFIFYGEEIGMAGAAGLPEDEPLRIPMSWRGDPLNAGFTHGTPFRKVSDNVQRHNVAAEQSDPNSLLAFYTGLIGLRQQLPAIARGSYLAATVQGQVMSYQREFEGQRVVVAINYGRRPAPLQLAELPAGRTLQARWPAEGSALRSDAQGQAAAQLPPQSVQVWVVQ